MVSTPLSRIDQRRDLSDEILVANQFFADGSSAARVFQRRRDGTVGKIVPCTTRGVKILERVLLRIEATLLIKCVVYPVPQLHVGLVFLVVLECFLKERTSAEHRGAAFKRAFSD